MDSKNKLLGREQFKREQMQLAADRWPASVGAGFNRTDSGDHAIISSGSSIILFVNQYAARRVRPNYSTT